MRPLSQASCSCSSSAPAPCAPFVPPALSSLCSSGILPIRCSTRYHLRNQAPIVDLPSVPDDNIELNDVILGIYDNDSEQGLLPNVRRTLNHRKNNRTSPRLAPRQDHPPSPSALLADESEKYDLLQTLAAVPCPSLKS